MLLVAHFGNGDEDDQNLIIRYCSQFGEISKVTIFPGISYGHLEFKEVESAVALMKSMDSENVKTLIDDKKERQLVFFFTHLSFDELKNKASVDFPCSTIAHSQIIPGLYIFDEFITEGKL